MSGPFFSAPPRSSTVPGPDFLLCTTLLRILTLSVSAFQHHGNFGIVSQQSVFRLCLPWLLVLLAEFWSLPGTVPRRLFCGSFWGALGMRLKGYVLFFSGQFGSPVLELTFLCRWMDGSLRPSSSRCISAFGRFRYAIPPRGVPRR